MTESQEETTRTRRNAKWRVACVNGVEEDGCLDMTVLPKEHEAMREAEDDARGLAEDGADARLQYVAVRLGKAFRVEESPRVVATQI